MNRRELIIKTLAKVLGLKESQIAESVKNYPAFNAFNRTELLCDAEPEEIAAYESMDRESVRKQLESFGIDMVKLAASLSGEAQV